MKYKFIVVYDWSVFRDCYRYEVYSKESFFSPWLFEQSFPTKDEAIAAIETLKKRYTPKDKLGVVYRA